MHGLLRILDCVRHGLLPRQRHDCVLSSTSIRPPLKRRDMGHAGARGLPPDPPNRAECPTYSTDPLNTLDREPSLNLQTSDGMRMNGDPSYGIGFLCLSKNCTIYAPICGSGGRLNKGSSEPSVGKYRIPFVTLVPKRIHWALSL